MPKTTREIWVKIKGVKYDQLFRYTNKKDFYKAITHWTKRFKEDDIIEEVQIKRLL